MRNAFKSLLLAFTTLIAGTVAYAQVTTSSLSGIITDEKGETVIGAAVVATHTPSGTVYGGITNTDGRYYINGMRAGGPYNIEISNLGYQSVIFKDVTLQLGENFVLDAYLNEATEQLMEAVVVADEGRFRRERNGAATNISSRQIESIPTVSRSMNDVMALTPQATSNGGFSVGGGNYRGSSVTVDGAAFNNAFGIGQNMPAGGTPISLDAIEQISVNITPFDVRQSGFQGGAINAVTKSGTNQWHATVYDYFTSDYFRGYEVAGNGVTHTKSLNHTIGASIGGPIVKNKLFFFVNGEYTFDTLPGSTRVARGSASDKFGSDLSTNRPTVAQMDDMAKYVGDKFNYNPGRYQGYDLSTPDYKIMARLDWNINDNNRLNVRFSHTHNYYSSAPSTSMSPVGGNDSTFKGPNGENIAFNRNTAGRQSIYALYYEAARYYQEQNFTSVAAELNSRFGNVNNMLRAAWSHQFEPRSYVGDLFPTVDIMSNDGFPVGSDTYGMLTTIGVDPFTYGNLRDVQTITVTDEVSFNAGIHNFIAGAQFEWNSAKNGFMQGGAGWYIYDSWESFKTDVESNGTKPMASAFMITHANLEDPTAQAFPTFNYSQASVYAQDEITFSPYFKLTAGLRLELPIVTNPYNNLNKDFASLGEKNPESSFAGLSTADLPALSLNVSPRIGFNWDILKDRSLVLRGGTGIFTGRIPNVWLVSAMGNSNVLQYQYIANMSTGASAPAFSNNRADIINNVWKANGGWKVADLTAPTSTTIIAKDLKMPASWKSSLALDANLPGGIKATLEGIFSYNFNEVYATSLGYKQDGTIQLPGEPEAREKWVSEGIKNSEGRGVNGYYVHNINNAGHGLYYSVTAQLSKSFDWGLDLMAAYTHSDARTLSDGGGDQISEFGNIQTISGVNSPMLGYAYYVAPNRVIANASYTIKEGSHAATKLGIFYEGINNGYLSGNSYTRLSYLMNNVSGAGKASQLIYVPTTEELKAMPWGDVVNKDGKVIQPAAANKADYEAFIAGDPYLKNIRGQYSKRNGAVAPFVNRINVRVAHEWYFQIAGRKQTFEIGVDVKNVGNIFNSNWGVYKNISSNIILSYDTKAEKYTFNAPKWTAYNNLASTWQALLSARWSF